MGKLDKWLAEGWRECYKWLSVQLSVLSAAALSAYDIFPGIQDYVPPRIFRIIMLAMFLLILVGRLKKQRTK